MTLDNVESPVSRNAATGAGRILRNSPSSHTADEYQTSFAIAQRWRAQHVEPTESCFKHVLDCSRQFDQSVATYRLKRMKSIIGKIRRPQSHFKLGELDDIGGCRLIVKTNDDVSRAAEYLQSTLSLKNHGQAQKDYISSPARSGYRSRHLLTNIPTDYGNYHVEIQIRTKLQHYWATAIEATDEIYGTNYKSGGADTHLSAVDNDGIRFFTIVSSLFALEERSPQIPGFTGDRDSLIGQLNELDCASQLLKDLRATTDSVFEIHTKLTECPELFLLKFSRANQYLDIDSFQQDHLKDALIQYDKLESEIQSGSSQQILSSTDADTSYDNVVLVYAQNPKQLDIAYPNYSANVNQFVEIVSHYLD
jgi:putative GTP pyrophosphokinase